MDGQMTTRKLLSSYMKLLSFLPFLCRLNSPPKLLNTSHAICLKCISPLGDSHSIGSG